MEKITTRVPVADLIKIEKLASKSGVSKSEMTRRIIQQGLNSKSKLTLDILIELLMSERQKNNTEEINIILANVDEFKQAQGLKK